MKTSKRIIIGLITFILVIFVGFTIWQVNIKPLIPSIYLFRGFILETEDADESLRNYRSALASDSYFDWDVTNIVAERLVLTLETGEIRKKYVEKILDVLMELEQPSIDGSRQPDIRYMSSQDLLIRIYNLIFLYQKDFEALRRAEKIAKEAIEFNNQNSIFYQLLGETRMLQGDYQAVINLLQERLKINNDYIKFYRGLGIAYLKAGDKPAGAQALKRSIDLGYIVEKYNLDYALKVGRLFEELEDYAMALEVYQRALKCPKSGAKKLPQLYISLANTYLKLDDKERARQVAEILGILPNFKSQVDEFLNAIDEK